MWHWNSCSYAVDFLHGFNLCDEVISERNHVMHAFLTSWQTIGKSSLYRESPPYIYCLIKNSQAVKKRVQPYAKCLVWKKLWNTGGGQEMAVMVSRSVKKILITTIQVNFVLIPGMRQHKFTWIVVIKVFFHWPMYHHSHLISWPPPVFHNFFHTSHFA